MNDTRRAAKRAGILYLVFALVAILGEFAFPSFVVIGDAAATARNISAGESLYRFSILTGFATVILHIVVVAALYELLKPVEAWQARLMVLLVAVGVAVALANLFNRFAPLVLLSGADYLAVFPKAQLETLALASLRFRSATSAVVLMFWGLWLFPFGLLVYRSGFVPRILGVLILLAGFAYVTTSSASIVAPAYRPVVGRFMTPLYVGEVPIIFWLLFGSRSLGGIR
jgi:uncharacterized protein DUF4386